VKVISKNGGGMKEKNSRTGVDNDKDAWHSKGSELRMMVNVIDG
jgi:hypothetical protein